LQTIHGETSIRWELRDDGLQVELVVPAECHATFLPPGGFEAACCHFESGTHRFLLQRDA